MKVLIVTNMYPYPEYPYYGIHVKRQVSALQKEFPTSEFRVAFLNTRVDKRLFIAGNRLTRNVELEFNPDVIHVHFGLTQWMTLACRTPQVLTLHGSDVHRASMRRATKALAWRCRELVFVSSQLRASFGASPSAPVIPCGVDTGEFFPRDRVEARHRLGLPRDQLIVAFPGDPGRPEKNIELFTSVIEKLRRVRPTTTVVLSGLRPEEVPLRLAASDVVLFTSRYEGSPVASKEAMCCGTRVVSTDVGDMRDQLAGMSGCSVVEEASADHLLQAVLEAANSAGPDPHQAESRFGAVSGARRLMSLYEEARRAK